MRDRFGHDVKVVRDTGPCRVYLRISSEPEELLLLSYPQPLPETGRSPRGDRADLLVHARACEPYADAIRSQPISRGGGSFCVPTATTDGSWTLPWPRPARRPNKPGRFFAMKRWPKCTFGTSRIPATLSRSCAAPKRRALAQRRTCLPLARWSLGGRGDESPT